MKKLSAVLGAVLLAGGLTTATLAHDEGNMKEPMMRGTISKIDHSSGQIELKTNQGTSQVYFAPEAIKNLKEGDQIALELETSQHEGKEAKNLSMSTNKGR